MQHSMAGVSQSSPLTAPNFSPQKDGHDLRLSNDRNFASHGKVMMLVLVISFISFFLFLIILIYSKRPNRPLPKSDFTAEPELHPTIQFPGPLGSSHKGLHSGPQPPLEPEKSGRRTHQTVQLNQLLCTAENFQFLQLRRNWESGSSIFLSSKPASVLPSKLWIRGRLGFGLMVFDLLIMYFSWSSLMLR